MSATLATDTHPHRTTTPARRRATAALLALAVLLSVLGLTGRPAAAYAPTSPVAMSIAQYTTHVRVFWAPPSDTGGKAVTSYRIERWRADGVLPEKVWNQGSTAPLVDKTLTPGVVYKYRYQATNADGVSAFSPFKPATLSGSVTETWKFGSNPGDFVDRQFVDFIGRAPTLAERVALVQKLNNGTTTPATVINDLALQPERVELRHPVTRLYFAYFDRAPDHAGLDYWISQRMMNAKLDAMSNKFATSPEFVNTYGSLTNGQFVDLVYQNVLDRNPDQAGYASWKAKLDAKTITRGRLMTQFSESGEFKILSKGRVLAADTWDTMLDEQINPVDLSKMAPHIQSGGSAGGIGTLIMLLNKYTFVG